MLNVWPASCGVLPSRTDVKLEFWDLSLAEAVFDGTKKQKIKKHVLPNISKITKLLSYQSLEFRNECISYEVKNKRKVTCVISRKQENFFSKIINK